MSEARSEIAKETVIVNLPLWLERWPAILALATTMDVVMSAANMLGYFSVLGHHFIGILSASDYITSSIEWAPVVFPASIISVSIVTIMNKYANRRAKADSRAITILILFICSSTGLLFIVLWVFFEHSYQLFIVNVLSEIGLFATFLPGVLFSNALSRVSRNSRVFIISIIPTIAILAMAGGLQAERDIASGTNYNLIQLTDGQNEYGVILRTVDRGVIFRETISETIGFIRWEQIRRLETRYPHLSSNSASCDLLKINCRKVENRE
jgi:hypothetical protein